MSDAQNPAEPIVADEIETVQVRRAPKYGAFLGAGAALGIIVTMILTFAFDGTGAASPNTGLVYSTGQVFGFLALIFIPVGLALGGGIALAFDRAAGRRARSVRVDHETVQQQS